MVLTWGGDVGVAMIWIVADGCIVAEAMPEVGKVSEIDMMTAISSQQVQQLRTG